MQKINSEWFYCNTALFQQLILPTIPLNQGLAKSGPRAKSGPKVLSIRTQRLVSFNITFGPENVPMSDCFHAEQQNKFRTAVTQMFV